MLPYDGSRAGAREGGCTRTKASIGGHPLHMMVVHFPMAFLIGGFLADGAAVFGVPVPPALASWLLLAGLVAGVGAMVPGAVDLVATLRPAGGHRVTKALRHAILSVVSLGVFAVAWKLRGGLTSVPGRTVLLVELIGVALLMVSALLGGSLILEDRVGVAGDDR